MLTRYLSISLVRMNHMNQSGHCNCPHHKIGAVLIILFGLTFLLGMMNILAPMWVAYSWPTLIILFGITRLASGSCKCYMKS
jgi:hypothetical protein